MEHKEAKKINWSMLLSHHAECDNDRTFRFFRVRLCSRCFGMLLGVAIGVVLTKMLAEPFPWWGVIILFFFMQPAGVDFLMHELHVNHYHSSNSIRITTGILFGVAVSVAVVQLIYFDRWIFLIGVLAVSAYTEIMIAWLFFRTGHLECYLKKYEDAVYKADCKSNLP